MINVYMFDKSVLKHLENVIHHKTSLEVRDGYLGMGRVWKISQNPPMPHTTAHFTDNIEAGKAFESVD